MPPVNPNRLLPDEKLLADERLYAPNGRSYLHYQTDGNLVLRRLDGGLLWASNTMETVPGLAIMQLDGNFVVYDAAGTPRFQSGTTGRGGSYLQILNDFRIIVTRDREFESWTGEPTDLYCLTQILNNGSASLTTVYARSSIEAVRKADFCP